MRKQTQKKIIKNANERTKRPFKTTFEGNFKTDFSLIKRGVIRRVEKKKSAREAR